MPDAGESVVKAIDGQISEPFKGLYLRYGNNFRQSNYATFAVGFSLLREKPWQRERRLSLLPITFATDSRNEFAQHAMVTFVSTWPGITGECSSAMKVILRFMASSLLPAAL